MHLDKERVYKILHEKNSVQRKIAAGLYPILERIGFHLTANHFYDISPDLRLISRDHDDERTILDQFVDWNATEKLFCDIIQTYVDEYFENREKFGYSENNYYFSGLDSLFYYCYLREKKPPRIVEIGQGFSTRIALAALTRNAATGHPPSEFVSIDPYARYHPNVDDIRPVKFSSIKTPFQASKDVMFSKLVAGDMLFVDSSHVFKFGSDVQVLFEQIYPELDSGVDVHIHDIFTPFDYPKQWMVQHRRFWNEQYFLESFLTFNDSYRVLFPVHYYSRKSKQLHDLLINRLGLDMAGIKNEGASFYLQKTK